MRLPIRFVDRSRRSDFVDGSQGNARVRVVHWPAYRYAMGPNEPAARQPQ